jgi:Tol biopolymer transport system component
VVYAADRDTLHVRELYSVPIGGPAADGVKLNGILVLNGNVTDFRISPDSSRVVYLSDQDTDGVVEMYSVPIGGPAMVGVKLSVPLVSPGNINGFFFISPDSSRVVYIAQPTATVYELYSVPIGGPAATGVLLNDPLGAGKNISDFRISPNSIGVVYISDQQTANVFELYSVPIGGPAAARIKLNGALALNGNVTGIRISPDSRRVVYNADQQTDQVFELYSVPITGPAAAGVKLNGPLVPGGSASGLISPDSRRVVYHATQQTGNVRELYSVPIEGPAAAGVKLTGPLVQVNGGWWGISPDGSRVVYIGNQLMAIVSELYSVPTGGPAAAGVKLNDPLILNGNVTMFQISPDSGRVLYVADQDTDEVFELYMTSNYLIYLPLILRQG